jgi:hypothetical protein
MPASCQVNGCGGGFRPGAARFRTRAALDINPGRNTIHDINFGKSQLTVKAAAYPLSCSPYCRRKL